MIYYFGTFNPIHNGHIIIAEYVQKWYGHVIFVPAYDSPWKPGLKDNYEHRCNMIKLCGFECSKIEKELPTPSYTYQTINALYNGEKITFITGADQFAVLEQWKNYEEIIKKCKFIVMARGGIKINRNVEYEVLPLPEINISSTQVRDGILTCVPDNVAEYIRKNNLYDIDKK